MLLIFLTIIFAFGCNAQFSGYLDNNLYRDLMTNVGKWSGTANTHQLMIDLFRYYGVKPILEKQNKTGGRISFNSATNNASEITHRVQKSKNLFYVTDNSIMFGTNAQNEYLVCGSVTNMKQALWSYAILAQFKNASVPLVVCIDCCEHDYYDIFNYLERKQHDLKRFDQAKAQYHFSYTNLIASFSVVCIFLHFMKK